MPPANRDASELTRQRKSMTLYAWSSQNTAAVNTGASVLREQQTTQTLDVVVQRQQGGCYCATQGQYPLVGCGPCGRG